MKILILSDSWPPESMGGADKVAFNLAREILSRGHNIRVVTTTQDKNLEGEFEYKGIRGWRVYAKYHERWRAYLSLYNPQTVRRVKKIIEDFKPEIVHAHNIHFYLSYACLKVAKKSGAKVFLTAHDTMSFSYGKLRTEKYLNSGIYRVTFLDNLASAKKRFNPFRNFIIRIILNKYVNIIFAVSNELKKSLILNGVRNVVVVHNSIDIDYWNVNDYVSYYKKYYKLDNKKVVLFSARLSGGKGGEKIILAMGKVVKKIPNTVLLILGERNKYALEMDDLVKKMNMNNNIIFTGWISGPSLREIYHISDVICTPSVYLDPFPTVNLEAMACGKPVVGTCFGGTKELVVDKKSGYIVDPRNINILAEKIIDLLKNKDKAEEFGLYGKEIVKKYFRLDFNVDYILNIFKK